MIDVVNFNKTCHKAINLHNITYRLSKCLLTLFRVDLKSTNNADTLKLKLFLHTKIRFERLHSKRIPLQCHNCQFFKHTKKHCAHCPHCVKSEDEHPSAECTKSLFQQNVFYAPVTIRLRTEDVRLE